jgi:hypothetical protein
LPANLHLLILREGHRLARSHVALARGAPPPGVQSSETDSEIEGSLSCVDSSSVLVQGKEAKATICATMGKMSPSLVRFEP